MQKKANHLAAACLSVLTLTAAIGMPAVSAEHYNVYNYDRWGEAVPAQAGYAAQRAVSGQDLGCGAFNTRPICSGTGRIAFILQTAETTASLSQTAAFPRRPESMTS
ncbi:MAG: hypothetical protein ACLT3Y_01980 [Ruminococcus callidus]